MQPLLMPRKRRTGKCCKKLACIFAWQKSTSQDGLKSSELCHQKWKVYFCIICLLSLRWSPAIVKCPLFQPIIGQYWLKGSYYVRIANVIDSSSKPSAFWKIILPPSPANPSKRGYLAASPRARTEKNRSLRRLPTLNFDLKQRLKKSIFLKASSCRRSFSRS